MINEIVGTLLELSVFFYVFYKLLDIDRSRLLKYLLLYLSMTSLVVISNHFFLGYGAFLYVFT